MTYVSANGIAQIRHAQTGEVYEIDADELDFQAIGADERHMGPAVYHQADIEHPALGTLVWGLWEYPIGIENMQETDVGEHELLEDISYGLQHEPDFDDPPDDESDLEAMLSRLPTQLSALDAMLVRLSQPSGLIGHNLPPPEFQLVLGDDDIARLRDSILAVQGELSKPDAVTSADPTTLAEAHNRFMGLGSKLGSFGKWAGIATGTGVFVGLGRHIGEQVWTEAPALHSLVHSILETLSVWIHAISTLL
ncbi:MAG: hypothetical protein R3E04_03325 [Sphingobium sp.]